MLCVLQIPLSMETIDCVMKDVHWRFEVQAYELGIPGILLCMRPANERWRYTVTPSFIGWAHTQKDPCILLLTEMN